MGREWNRHTRMSTLSWVIFRSKTHFFRNFVEGNFLDDFLMDFYRTFIDFETILGRFWEDFGRVSGTFFNDFSHFLRKRRSSKFVRPRSVS